MNSLALYAMVFSVPWSQLIQKSLHIRKYFKFSCYYYRMQICASASTLKLVFPPSPPPTPPSPHPPPSTYSFSCFFYFVLLPFHWLLWFLFSRHFEHFSWEKVFSHSLTPILENALARGKSNGIYIVNRKLISLYIVWMPVHFLVVFFFLFSSSVFIC